MFMTPIYPTDAYPFSRAELIEKLKAKLSPHRFQHVLGVEQAALELAERYGANPVQASIAGLCHDYAKEIGDDDYRKVIMTQQFDLDLLNWNNNVWHGYVGPYFIETELGLHDPAILQAVHSHTMGRPKMSTLEQIIFVADYIEPGRDFPEVVRAREVAKSDLSDAVMLEVTNTIDYLVTRKIPIYPDLILTFNDWAKK